MTPKPLYRSLTLWSGILMIGFVCWGWWFSLTNFSSAGWGRLHATNAAGGFQVGYSDLRAGGIEFSSSKDTVTVATDEFEIPSGGKRRAIIYIFDRPQPDPWAKPLGIAGAGGFTVFIPHWLILLAVLLLWVGLLFWRVRRLNRPNPLLGLP